MRNWALARMAVCITVPALLAAVGGCVNGGGTTVVTIAPSPISAAVGEFVELTVTVTVDGTPAANRTVDLSFSTDYIAVVIPESVVTGAQGTATTTLEGHNAGVTQLTAASGGVNSAPVAVTVTTPAAG